MQFIDSYAEDNEDWADKLMHGGPPPPSSKIRVTPATFLAERAEGRALSSKLQRLEPIWRWMAEKQVFTRFELMLRFELEPTDVRNVIAQAMRHRVVIRLERAHVVDRIHYTLYRWCQKDEASCYGEPDEPACTMCPFRLRAADAR